MSRFVAGLCLIAMLGSWAPHAHSGDAGSDHSAFSAHHETTSNLGRPLSVSSDDAHDEHSSRPSIDSQECLVCRSAEEREGDRVRPTPLAALDTGASRIGALPGHPLPTILALGLHPTRAPPLG